MTTRKTIALTRWTFVGKVMSFVCVCGEGVGLDCLFNFIYFNQIPPLKFCFCNFVMDFVNTW